MPYCRHQSANYDDWDRYELPPSDQARLTAAAEANWTAQRLEPGVTPPVGNTSSVNTGDIVYADRIKPE